MNPTKTYYIIKNPGGNHPTYKDAFRACGFNNPSETKEDPDQDEICELFSTFRHTDGYDCLALQSIKSDRQYLMKAAYCEEIPWNDPRIRAEEIAFGQPQQSPLNMDFKPAAATSRMPWENEVFTETLNTAAKRYVDEAIERKNDEEIVDRMMREVEHKLLFNKELAEEANKQYIEANRIYNLTVKEKPSVKKAFDSPAAKLLEKYL